MSGFQIIEPYVIQDCAVVRTRKIKGIAGSHGIELSVRSDNNVIQDLNVQQPVRFYHLVRSHDVFSGRREIPGRVIMEQHDGCRVGQNRCLQRLSGTRDRRIDRPDAHNVHIDGFSVIAEIDQHHELPVKIAEILADNIDCAVGSGDGSVRYERRFLHHANRYLFHFILHRRRRPLRQHTQ